MEEMLGDIRVGMFIDEIDIDASSAKGTIGLETFFLKRGEMQTFCSILVIQNTTRYLLYIKLLYEMFIKTINMELDLFMEKYIYKW